MKTSQYIPDLRYGDRVRFIEIGGDPKYGRECTVIRVVPNPSSRNEHQWYDVKFDDASTGRFQAKNLVLIGADERAGAA